jgi:spore coat protein U-like protein
MYRVILSVAAIVGALVSQTCWAATATSSLAVSANVTTVCTMSSTPLAFGEVAITGATTAATSGTATVSVTCTGGGTYTVGMDNGLHNVAAQRFLASGSNLLAYGLFQDPAHGTVWTNTGAGLVLGTGNAAVQPLTIYGAIPTGLPLVSGSGIPYSDTVQVTLTY